MKVAYVSGLGQVWGRYPPDVLSRSDRTVGGGECALLRTAFGLAKRGHDVTAYIPLEGGGEQFFEGVRFRDLARRSTCITDGTAAIVSWSDDRILFASAKQSPGQRRVFSQQLNDMPPGLEVWQAIDIIISPAKMHAEFLVSAFAPNKAPFRFVLMPSGIDRWRYDGQPAWKDRPLRVSYWSSPDRGLHHLLHVWSDIQKKIPGVQLDVFYHLDKFARQFSESDWPYGEIAWRARTLREQIESVDFKVHGAVSRPVLAKTQVQTRVMAYPLDPVVFTESFATSIGEALAAGCRVVAHPADAIRDIWGDAVRWVEAPICGPEFRAAFRDAVMGALTAEEWPETVAAEKVLERYTWEHASERVERAISIDPLPPPGVK